MIPAKGGKSVIDLKTGTAKRQSNPKIRMWFCIRLLNRAGDPVEDRDAE